MMNFKWEHLKRGLNINRGKQELLTHLPYYFAVFTWTCVYLILMWCMCFKGNLLLLCVQGKKDVCQIFNNILRRQIGTRSPTVEYFCSHQEVLFILLKGWDETRYHSLQLKLLIKLNICVAKKNTYSEIVWHLFSICFAVVLIIVFPPCRYETPQVALNCGIMLRECIRHEPLAKIILHSEHFNDFFSYVEMSTFDIASDAFATFKARTE